MTPNTLAMSIVKAGSERAAVGVMLHAVCYNRCILKNCRLLALGYVQNFDR